MSIKEFIQNEVLLPRLKQVCVLVVYDQERRYRELCLELATEKRQVIDASESSIESREAAMAAFQDLGQVGNSALEEMLVYVPAGAPMTDEERQRDPFSVYGVCGAVFPSGDGDEYLSLCLKARADYATEIRRIFADNPDPDFAVIDAVGGGAGWPQLQALLNVESARDILFSLLAPSERQQEALKRQDGWVPEAKALLQSALGLKLMTRAKSWGPVADELWRFVLFSEFVFDLPGALPDALEDVPHAKREARLLVEDLCDRLRNDLRMQALYVERAEAVEAELNLVEACQSLAALGERDTFPFEERTFFVQAVDAFRRDDLDRLRLVLKRHQTSVWVGKGENQAQWLLLGAAMSLVEGCEDAERQLPEYSRSQDSLIDFYVASMREVDRRQRELEQIAGDSIGDTLVAEVVIQARMVYRRVINVVQDLFVRHLEKSGWPPSGRLANADVFDKVVAPKLQESGRRVALFLIDALRYELGVELQKQLVQDGKVELQTAFVQLPSVTPVGMASLLPGAGHSLRLIRKDNQMLPALDDLTLSNVSQRMEVLRKRYGQRFTEVPLADFARNKLAVPETVELLVIRSNEMDNDFESNPEAAPSLINRTFQRVRAAMKRLHTLGFHEAVIATDHGFYLNTMAEAGDVAAKPPGKWLSIHDRLLLGEGQENAANFSLPAEAVGIRGDFGKVAGPRALVAYRAGQTYFHGGASLQEAVVPVISVRFQPAKESFGKPLTVSLTYKRGAKRITTRLPVIEVAVGSGDLFSAETTVNILLEAYNKKGDVVGEAKPGGLIDPATRTLSLGAEKMAQVTLKMNEDFEGKFTVKALDPATLTVYSKLDLETDYVV